MKMVLGRRPITAEYLARRFHELYERLAPEFGYETRPDTKRFNPESANGRLMIAVCGRILHELDGPVGEEKEIPG